MEIHTGSSQAPQAMARADYVPIIQIQIQVQLFTKTIKSTNLKTISNT